MNVVTNMLILDDALIEIESDDDHDLTGLISWNLHQFKIQ